MTDQQLLGVNRLSDVAEIKKALIGKISNLDFEIDIESVFNYIHCSKRLIQKTDQDIVEDEIVINGQYQELAKDFDKHELYDTPEKLIMHFTFLYDTPATRFNKLLWKSAIESLKEYESVKLEEYLKPVANFLNEKPFLKSEVLKLIVNVLPFEKFFINSKDVKNDVFWSEYSFVYNLLYSSNIDLDLHADELNTGEFTSEQLDNLYGRLLNSGNYYKANNLQQAFNELYEGIPADVKPLLVWRRELNILYKAAFVQNIDNVAELFQNVLHNALTVFPEDEELLYMKAKLFSHFYEPEQLKEEIIRILKIIPHHEKCFFLLGKCYMKLGIARAAMTIFENLKKSSPLNMQYVVAAASAGRKYIDFCISEHDPKDNNKTYYVRMITTLIEKEMFDEVAVFAAEVPKEDGDIKALLLYAKAIEIFLLTREKNREELKKALSLTAEKEIIRKIKEYYLKDLPNWSDIQEEKDFIIGYYNEFPNDSDANYQKGMLHYAEADYENAYNFMLKAKEINPEDIANYYNLARVSLKLEIHSEALEYINIYLFYNKYNLYANEIYCDCTYALQQYRETHNGAKWILSLCRDNEFDPKYFFHFTTSLFFYMDQIEDKYHNAAYVNDMLELYDEYPKPHTFWINDNGSRSMYWAARLCYRIGHYEKGIAYLQCILDNVKEYNWELMERCKFQLLPECLHALQQYEKLISLLEAPTAEVLQQQENDPSVRLSCFYISYAYGMQANNEKKMQWSLNCIKCYLQMSDPPVDWIINNLLVNFQTCLQLNMESYLILFGNIYLDFVAPPRADHIWLTHNFANFCAEKGNQGEALRYHQMCVEFGSLFPEEMKELTDNSQDFINTVKPGNLI